MNQNIFCSKCHRIPSQCLCRLMAQDGISLNSMAHPITNTPEPSYEIDPDKLETIEIDLPSPKPVAWMSEKGILSYVNDIGFTIPLYTHPAEHDLAIAEAIGFEKGHESAATMLRKQEAQIEELQVLLDKTLNNWAKDMERLKK